MDTLVFDTAAVLNFGHRGNLNSLIVKLAKQHRLLTTPGVVAELTDPDRKKFYDAFVADWFKVQAASGVPFNFATLARLSRILDAGEITVIALAKELNATAVLDEKAARREADALGIKINGTLGLMQLAVKNKWMTDAQCLECVLKLCDSGFAIPRLEPHQTFVAYVRAVSLAE
jgi:predicted nucleic acid-binding protein